MGKNMMYIIIQTKLISLNLRDMAAKKLGMGSCIKS